jgi:cytochrome c peroxidase
MKRLITARMLRWFGGFGLLLWGLVGCGPAADPPPAQLARYDYAEPDHFAEMLLPAEPPVTELGVALGRRLFYDPVLSLDSSISCASCHLPALAFTDGRAFSTGVGGRPGRRSSMSLVNVGYYHDGFFWDGRAQTLEEQVLHPIRDTLEMAVDPAVIDERLRRHPYYGPELARLPSAGERPWVIALAQFQRSLISADAKYDRVRRGEAQYTESEQRGFDIFFDVGNGLPTGECAHCHTEPHFTNRAFENNGLNAAIDWSDFPDPGRGAITGVAFETGKFRVPTLRNIALTAPYMHDGRFATLEEVIDHYNQGGHYAPNVNPNIHPLGLSERDRADLLAFLQTLTDTNFVTNEAFHNPFLTDAPPVELSQNLVH